MYVGQSSLLIWACCHLHFKERLSRLFVVVVYKLVMLMLYCYLWVVCVYQLSLLALHWFVYLHTQIALYYNVWPEAIFHIETKSRRLTKCLI